MQLTRQAVYPINAIKEDFLLTLSSTPLTLLVAPPGAGKSTVLPLWLLEENFPGKILLVQPRRVAAKNIALYLASQLGENVGQRIGYRLRNDTKVGRETQLEVITEGVLLRMIQADPELADVSCILFDEFHERASQADLTFALAREIQLGLRDDLSLVLMSATLAASALLEQLPDAKIVVSEGKQFPVDITYTPIESNRFWHTELARLIERTCQSLEGTVLVFLPGRGDIERVAEVLTSSSMTQTVNKLFGDMPLEQQRKAISPDSHGKVILSTNIAETSLTIDGISLVIDSGFEKQAIYQHDTQTNRLTQKRISQASAIQRAGRAGRQAPGKCIRLYSQSDFERLAEHAPLDILQTDLVPLVIEAVKWGVTKLADLPLLTLPKPHLEQEAWHTLAQLKIIDENKKLTAHGNSCSRLPCHPRLAHMIMRAFEAENQGYEGATYLACVVAALLENKDILSFAQGHTDVSFIARVNALTHRSAKYPFIIKQANQLMRYLEGEVTPYSLDTLANNHKTLDLLAVMVAWAYPERIAKQRNSNGQFVSTMKKGYHLNDEDALCESQYLAVADLSQIEQKLTIRIAQPLSLAQIKQWQLAPIEQKAVCFYNQASEKIDAYDCVLLGQLVIEKKAQKQKVDGQAVQQLWQEQIQAKGLDWLNWSEEARQLRIRWQWLNQHQPHLVLPELTEALLMEQMPLWLLPYTEDCWHKKALDKLDLASLLMNLLDYQQQQIVEQCAPVYYQGPTGRKCPITYDIELPAKVSLPMQEIYGLKQSPQIGDLAHNHGIDLVLELMSPANRPIQVTTDLANFWQGSYKAVQKEMKAKYPKHFWPDDPANAQPTNRTKKFMKTN